MEAKALDKLKCLECGHEHQITHQWLEKVSATRTSKERIWAVSNQLFEKLKCSKCNSKKITVESYETTTSMKDKSTIGLSGSSGMCRICGGDGSNGKCWKCGGSGYE